MQDKTRRIFLDIDFGGKLQSKKDKLKFQGVWNKIPPPSWGKSSMYGLLQCTEFGIETVVDLSKVPSLIKSNEHCLWRTPTSMMNSEWQIAKFLGKLLADF